MLITEGRTVTRDLVHIIGATCDNCGKELKLNYGPSIINIGANEEIMADSLTITLHGVYNGFFDGPDLNVTFCHECADKFCEVFPCIRKCIDAPEFGQMN
jgi:hypothetical protein